ncbi:murein biosynthesis integral membrane protein MurJ [Actinoplanes sp. KI2]|uniref:murein biosynthesis integral membrane protein MurJ n=1 Tax=Actinoplanes sp. KI2 TaxID=2983315 RepID=UPI0021D5C9BE|nr:murein biosynthesis integral membrane protein MurJ [Actinoplanes sp. KI2]MCU7722100.1 murein biosynthesis integral membrane protein MurJ [Actinoplanes sp. KI2]
MTGGLYNSANSRGLPPSADDVPSDEEVQPQPGTFEQTRQNPPGVYGRPVDPEAVIGPVTTSMPGVPLEQDNLPPQEVPAESQRPAAGGGLLRSSAIMAVGTLASRVTGFFRSALLVAALGTGLLADSFNTANTIPNIVFDLLLGGVLTAAHVPLLIRARNKSEKYGEEFEQRLFTVLLCALALITVAAMSVAPMLINLYGSKFTPAQHRIAVLFLLFFLPQIFFYGFAAVAGASLNARGRFAAPMWTPVINNIVVIGVLGAFMVITHGDKLTPETIGDGQLRFLAIGVTAGVGAQAFGLIPSMRALGFNFRPRFDFRRAELTQMWGMASWTLLYVVAQQVALVVYTNLANAAGARYAKETGSHTGVGLTPWTNAYAFFQLPYAVVAISIITAILPRMTQSAAEGKLSRLAGELREGLRLSLALMLPAVALLFGAASEICFVLFAHGNTSAASAEVIANVLRVFAIGLTPFAVLQLLQRGFYAQQDTRTPGLVAIFSTGIGALTAIVFSRVLSTEHVVLGIAGAQGISWAFGCLVSVVLLRRRVGRLGGREILTLFSKAAICSLAALAVAEIGHLVVGPHVNDSFVLSAILLAAQCVLGFGAFLAVAAVVRLPEINQVIGMVRRKIGR